MPLARPSRLLSNHQFHRSDHGFRNSSGSAAQRRMRRLRIRPWSNSAKPKSLGEAGIKRGTSCSTYVNHQSFAGGNDGCSNIIAVGLVYGPHVDRPYRCDGLSFFDHSIRSTLSRSSREQINICDTSGAAAGATGATRAAPTGVGPRTQSQATSRYSPRSAAPHPA